MVDEVEAQTRQRGEAYVQDNGTREKQQRGTADINKNASSSAGRSSRTPFGQRGNPFVYQTISRPTAMSGRFVTGVNFLMSSYVSPTVLAELF